MNLTLASRHAALWSAAVDMFGPYNLMTASERIPVAWKALWHNSVGDPERDRDFLIEHSPATYLRNITCPMLVLQGRNDPRVIEESREVVEQLRKAGKEVEYKVFENEGHDVLKYENKVTCYNLISEFFRKHRRP
jgi:dipeptidyl aminopeptidase/acylaminoacyl peptidase